MVKQPNAARYRLAANSPWLSFWRKDELFSRFAALAQCSKRKRNKEDDSGQMERLGWILALPDDDDWSVDDDNAAPIRIGDEM